MCVQFQKLVNDILVKCPMSVGFHRHAFAALMAPPGEATGFCRVRVDGGRFQVKISDLKIPRQAEPDAEAPSDTPQFVLAATSSRVSFVPCKSAYVVFWQER